MDKSDSFDNKDNLLRAELDVLINEYQLCTTRMIREVDSDEKGFEFNLIGIGAIIVATTFAVDKKAYFLFLLISLPFHLLTWALARRGIWTSFLVSYMTTILAPRINKIIQGTDAYQGLSANNAHFMSWEKYHWDRLDENPMLKIPIAMPLVGRALFQLAVALLTVFAYFLYKASDQTYIQSNYDYILLGLNAIFFGISIVTLSIANASWAKRIKKNTNDIQRTKLSKKPEKK